MLRYSLFAVLILTLVYAAPARAACDIISETGQSTLAEGAIAFSGATYPGATRAELNQFNREMLTEVVSVGNTEIGRYHAAIAAVYEQNLNPYERAAARGHRGADAEQYVETARIMRDAVEVGVLMRRRLGRQPTGTISLRCRGEAFVLTGVRSGLPQFTNVIASTSRPAARPPQNIQLNCGGDCTSIDDIIAMVRVRRAKLAFVASAADGSGHLVVLHDNRLPRHIFEVYFAPINNGPAELLGAGESFQLSRLAGTSGVPEVELFSGTFGTHTLTGATLVPPGTIVIRQQQTGGELRIEADGQVASTPLYLFFRAGAASGDWICAVPSSTACTEMLRLQREGEAIIGWGYLAARDYAPDLGLHGGAPSLILVSSNAEGATVRLIFPATAETRVLVAGVQQ